LGKFIDIAGQRFGRLTVIKRAERPEHIKNGTYWLCKCDCGNEKVVRGSHLKDGTTQSCRCMLGENWRNRIIDLTGKKFNKLTVVSLHEKRKQKRSSSTKLYWLCKCDCGNTTILCGDEIKSMNTKSCGCSRYIGKGRATLENTIIAATKHGAKARNLDYALEDSLARFIINQSCFYCGGLDLRINRSKKSKPKYRINGIDRIDSSKGYEIDNVVPCCKICNYIKMDMGLKEFLEQIEKIYNHSIKNKEK